MHPFEVGLVGNARKAFAVRNTTALELLQRRPNATMIDLAKELDAGASALGVLLAAYQDAQPSGCIRDLARDTLYRQLLWQFPSGWGDDGDGSPICKIFTWSLNLAKVAPKLEDNADNIIRALTQISPPPDGWRPASKDDPRLKQVFDQYWPADES